MNLNGCIKEILDRFKAGDYFDSHVIINELITNHDYHIVYLKEYSENCTINQYHGKIAKIIGSFDYIKPAGKKIKSHTIYRDISENELWQKV